MIPTSTISKIHNYEVGETVAVGRTTNGSWHALDPSEEWQLRRGGQVGGGVTYPPDVPLVTGWSAYVKGWIDPDDTESFEIDVVIYDDDDTDTSYID